MAADEKVAFSATADPVPARGGEAVILSVSTGIPAGYHLYSMTLVPAGPKPLKITLQSAPEIVREGPWYAPRPERAFDPNFQKKVEFFSGAVTHRTLLRVLEAAGPGEYPIAVSVSGQICDEQRCILQAADLSLVLRVEAGVRRGDRVSPRIEGVPFHPGQIMAGAEVEDLRSRGLLAFLLLAFLAGLGALLTPCVFPMIPITVSYFSKYKDRSLRRTVSLALVYSLSIIALFTLIGVAISVIFGAASMQRLSAHWLFNTFMVLLLVAFGLNLLGLFDIGVPQFLVSRTRGMEDRYMDQDGGPFLRQAVGIFFMAVTFTLVSFTCTVGFVGAVLAVAATGEWFWPSVGMLVFSFAFSLPFFFLAVFPSWAEKIRGKGGDWMNAIKVSLGFLELAGALKFLSNIDLVFLWGVVTRPLVLSFWTVLFGATALYLMRLFRLPSDAGKRPKAVGVVRLSFALLFAAFAIYSATGIGHSRPLGGWIDGWLPPAVYPGDELTSGGDHAFEALWIVDDLEQGFRKAKADQRALFVDFTGYTCTNCRYMESSVFPKPQVKKLLERMTLARAYTDGGRDVHQVQREFQIRLFGTAALPFYAIFDPATREVLARFASMTNDVDEFARFLESGLAEFESRKAKAALAAAPSPAAAPPQAAPAAGAWSIRLPDVRTGAAVSLADFKGKWIVLNYWASWCAPCKKELREIFPPFFRKPGAVELVTITFDGEEMKKAALKFLATLKIPRHTALLGPDDPAAAGLPQGFEVRNNSLPVSFLIDPEGKLVERLDGSMTSEILRKWLSR